MAHRLESSSRLLSANLLEAELRAVFARERLRFEPDLPAPISWVLPDRSLAVELAAVLDAGYCQVQTFGMSLLPCTLPHTPPSSPL